MVVNSDANVQVAPDRPAHGSEGSREGDSRQGARGDRRAHRQRVHLFPRVVHRRQRGVERGQGRVRRVLPHRVRVRARERLRRPERREVHLSGGHPRRARDDDDAGAAGVHRRRRRGESRRPSTTSGGTSRAPRGCRGRTWWTRPRSRTTRRSSRSSSRLWTRFGTCISPTSRFKTTRRFCSAGPPARGSRCTCKGTCWQDGPGAVRAAELRRVQREDEPRTSRSI